MSILRISPSEEITQFALRRPGVYLSVTTCIKSVTLMEMVAVAALIKELRKAEKKHPEFPEDPVYRTAILAEETGEAVQAALDLIHKVGTEEKLITELSHSGAMALRSLKNIFPKYL